MPIRLENASLRMLCDSLLALTALLSLSLAIFTMSSEALRTLQAIEHLNHQSDIIRSRWDLATKRLIQKDLLSQKVYVPLDMMITAADIAELSEVKETSKEAVRTLCPFARQTDRFVLVPLPFALPFYGTLVFDWCWSPSSLTKS